MHAENSFITLTFNEANCPADNSLDIVTFQKFMKRFRKSIAPQKIRFYACGEYGENYGRPHYHACIFGYSFPDKRPWKKTQDHILYRSQRLEQLWPYGYTSIGNVNFETAAYVARYIIKKINGKNADKHYEFINPDTGEITQLKPEYTNMSRGGRGKGQGGIGSGWLDQFLADVYPEDFVIINNKKLKPPKFYDARYELLSPLEYEKMKAKRKKEGQKHELDNTPDRLKVKETVHKSQINQLKRNLDL